MDHEYYEEVLDEVDGFIAEMEMDIKERRLEEAEGEENLRLLKNVLGLS